MSLFQANNILLMFKQESWPLVIKTNEAKCAKFQEEEESFHELIKAVTQDIRVSEVFSSA